jgi:hypothetical protein
VIEPRNPALLVGPGESGTLELQRGVLAFIARGERPGPVVWAWAPRGERDPSMAQALGELRDRLSPAHLVGAVGLLLEGPEPPFGRHAYPWAPAVRALSQEASAVVLLSSLPVGYEAAPHVAVDLEDAHARRLARALGAAYVAPEVVMPPLNRSVLTAPAVMWIDGESERLSRSVIDRAATALGSLLGTLGMTDDKPSRPDVRVVLKAIATVDAQGPGLVEPVVAPGDLVHLGQPVAYAGGPGTRTRRPLRASATGVVLYLRSGQVQAGDVMGIGKLRRALPLVERASRRMPASGRGFDVGWCEWAALPELGLKLKAKIDTGARTCAVHVRGMREAAIDDDGNILMDIEIPDGKARSRVTRVAVVEYAHVKDSGGHTERRPVIETLLQIGERAERVRVTLTDRGDMRFPMLIGRTALSGDVRVHPTRRFLLGRR